MILTDSHLLYMDNHSFFGRSDNDFHIWKVFPFWRLGASLNTILFFSHLFRVISPDNLSPYQGTLFLLSDFLRHAVCDVNPVNNFARQSVTIKVELVPLELFSQTSIFILMASFQMQKVRFQNERK